MHYIGGTAGSISLLGAGWPILVVMGLLLLIHLVYCIFIGRMALDKGRNALLWFVFALFFGSLAFILLYRKSDGYYDYE